MSETPFVCLHQGANEIIEAMPVRGLGCVVRTSIFSKMGVAESLVFVPGACIVDNKIVKRG